MSKFIVNMVDAITREVLDTEEEIFESEQDAQDFAGEWGGNFSQGAECLSLRGEPYTPREAVDFEVEEID